VFLDAGRQIPQPAGVQNEKSRLTPLPLLAALLFALIVLFHLGCALLGKAPYLAIYLGTALEYAHGQINLLHPVILGINATGTPTARELPLWQAVVALVFKATGSTWYGWANLVSLLLFATGLWPFFQLARQYVGERAAWWSLVFFLAEPLIVFEAGMASDDAFCLVLTLWFLFFADKMIRSGQVRWWLPTVLFACLGAVSKLPFFMAAGFCSIFLLVVNNVRSWRPWILLAAAGAMTAGALFIWTRYCDSLSARAVYPYLELRISRSPFIHYWYFGDLHTRLNPGGWIKGGWRFLHATLGSMPLVVLLLAAWLRPGNRLPKLWLLATFLTTLVFTHLILVHWHYYLMCCPAVAMLCGITLNWWEDLWAQLLPRPWLRLALVGLALILSVIDGMITMKVSIYYDSYPRQVSSLIEQYTKPDDRLMVCSATTICGGEELMLAGRKGFYAELKNSQGTDTVKGLYDLVNSEADMRRLRSLGYNKLVLISESPVRFAVEATNPGSQRKRIFYPATISPIVDAWPMVYRSEDILIREIPAEQPSPVNDTSPPQ
jgi:hypothetical protein